MEGTLERAWHWIGDGRGRFRYSREAAVGVLGLWNDMSEGQKVWRDLWIMENGSLLDMEG